MNGQEAPIHDIGWAVDQLKAGGRVRREGWNAKGMWLELDAAGQNGRPYATENGEEYPMQDMVFMKTFTDTIVPWVCSQTDLLAEDWEPA